MRCWFSLTRRGLRRGTYELWMTRSSTLGHHVSAQRGDEIIDCAGAVLMPGLVNGHTHLYSSLAVGMPAPPRPPQNFHEILQLVWWRLDRAHTLESVEVSGQIGALAALRCGTTTLIDHHASPNAIDGQLVGARARHRVGRLPRRFVLRSDRP